MTPKNWPVITLSSVSMSKHVRKFLLFRLFDEITATQEYFILLVNQIVYGSAGGFEDKIACVNYCYTSLFM